VYRSVFISDVHLGSHKNGEIFLEFLQNLQTKKLFLVGDLLDVVCDTPEPLLDRFFEILKSKDWEFYYFLGNHEKENPNFSKLEHYFSDIQTYNSFIYKSAQTKVYIEHGDSFHNKDIFNKLLKFSLKKFKRFLFKNKNKKEQLAKKEGIYYKIKPYIKNALYSSYIKYMQNLAKANSCDIIICGHLHQPEVIVDKNATYINCGDWTRNCTYVAEIDEAKFEILNYSPNE